MGSTRADAEHDRTHVSALAARLRELNYRLEDVRREQQYQREREAGFRDLSERTNARAVWYCVVQIGVLVGTCAWQLRHLRVSARLHSAVFLSAVLIYSAAVLRGQENALRCSHHASASEGATYIHTLFMFRCSDTSCRVVLYPYNSMIQLVSHDTAQSPLQLSSRQQQ